MSETEQRFAMGLRLKQFSVFTPEPDAKTMDKNGQKIKQEDESHLLSYKTAEIEGFSLYCDWHKTDAAVNGGIDLNKLRAED